MTVVIEVRDRIEPLATDWERLAEHTRASPFMRPGWFSAWWKAFGTGQLHILAAYEDGRLTGILPLRKARGALSSLTNGESSLFGFLAANESSAKALSHALFRQKPRQVRLSFVPPTGYGAALAREAATNAQYHVYAESSEAAPYVTTDGSWTEYEAGLRRKFRGELRRRRKRLGDEGRLALEVYDGREDLEKLLEEGFRIEGSGWKESHRTSINTNPALQRFYTDIARWAAERDWLRLAFLRINDRAVAFDYCFECDGTHYLQKTGYETAYRKFAPGVIMRQLMLERAFFSSDIVAYDFLGVGLGAESAAWKREWTNRQQDRLFMHIFSPTALGVCDRAVFEASNKGLDVAKKLVRNSALDERYRRALRRAYETMHSKLSR